MSVLRADAPFFWPLRGSLELQAGSGSVTYTRATAAWGFNETGKLYGVPSGAVRMRGYRPVINRIASSVSFATWTSANAGSGSVVGRTADYSAAPDGTTTAYRLQLSLGGGTAVSHVARIWRSTGVSINRSITSSIQLKTNDGSTVNVGIWLGSTVSIVSVGPSWSRKYHIGSSATDPTLYVGLMGGQTPACADSVDLLLAEVQTEDTTGQDDKTPAEFVSKGVLSSPWHGAGADGVKYFSTYEDGTPIPEANLLGARLNPNSITNNLRYCRDLTQSQVWKVSGYGANLITNGSFDTDVSGWAGSGTAVVTWSAGQLSLQMVGGSDTAYATIACVVGVKYIVQVSVASGTGSARFLIGTTVAGSQVSIVGQPTSGAAETFFAVFTATATTHYISLTINTTTTRLFDNVSVYAAGVTTALNQTGLDGLSNGATLLTANTSNPTILQTITAAAAAACSGYFVQRSVGSGSIYFTRDGGTNWTDITSLINNSTFTFVKIENTSVTNPQVGFKIATSGDAIIVDAGINHLGAQICETPILTTTAAVTVNADVLTAPTASNFSDTAGTILATVTRDDWAAGNGSAVGSSTRGLYTSSANSGAQGVDGTNTVNGPSGTPSGTMRIGIRWSGSSLQVFSNGVFQSAGSYDGSFNLASIAAAAGVQCTIKDIAIWQTSLSDADMISASKGMTIDGAAASLTLTAPDGHLLTGRTIAAAAVSLALTAPSSQIIIGRYIQASPANLSLAAPDGERIIGRYIQANAAIITLTAPDGRVLLDDSPRSAKTITATLASPTITARL